MHVLLFTLVMVMVMVMIDGYGNAFLVKNIGVSRGVSGVSRGVRGVYGVKGVSRGFRGWFHLYNTVSQYWTPEKVGKYTSFSFYKFIGIPEEKLNSIINRIKERLDELEIRGTLLVSTEGVNGQFCIPHDSFDEFSSTLKDVDLNVFNNIDLNIGETNDYPGEKEFPYKRLMVKRKRDILTTGPYVVGQSMGSADDDSTSTLPLTPPSTTTTSTSSTSLIINWNDSGEELDSATWHEALRPCTSTSMSTGTSTSTDESDSPLPPLILDCRNHYESEVGTFEGAIPLNTSIFSETWEVLEDLLREVPKARKIMTFCTGGIRCVKVNAFLRQRLGYDNVYSLKKGIIAYEDWTSHSGKSRFQGENFVFDRRRLADEEDESMINSPL